MDVEREIRKLRRWNAFFVIVLVLLAGWFLVRWQVSLVHESIHTLRYSRDGDMLRISAPWDGPFVVTHITAAGEYEPKLWAALPEPLAIIDSSGGDVDLAKLKWRDKMGEPADPPGSQTVEALYYEPEIAKEREPYVP